MSGFEIARATADDAPEIGAILSAWIEETPWMPRIHSYAQEQEFATDLVGRNWVHVAKHAGNILGFMARDQGKIHALYVARDARRTGIGGAFVNLAKRADTWLSLWTFVANENAQRFYLGAGFHEVERSDGAGNDEGLPDIRYEWRRLHA